MCDPISAILGLAATAGSSLLGGGSRRAATPPPPQIAAQPVNNVDAKAPVVQVADTDGKDTASAANGGLFAPKRKAGTAIGGLGKSGLALEL